MTREMTAAIRLHREVNNDRTDQLALDAAAVRCQSAAMCFMLPAICCLLSRIYGRCRCCLRHCCCRCCSTCNLISTAIRYPLSTIHCCRLSCMPPPPPPPPPPLPLPLLPLPENVPTCRVCDLLLSAASAATTAPLCHCYVPSPIHRVCYLPCLLFAVACLQPPPPPLPRATATSHATSRILTTRRPESRFKTWFKINPNRMVVFSYSDLHEN
jgi:hypothetical protein